MFQFFKKGVQKFTSLLGSKIQRLLGNGKIDQETLDKLEQLFYEADLGSEISHSLTQSVSLFYRKSPDASVEQILDHLRQQIIQEFKESSPAPSQAPLSTTSPYVILIVGVNGNGKTTTVAKLAKFHKDQGKKVLLGAADTFRAAATEQLQLWAERIKVDCVKGGLGSDPAAVAFDTLTAAKSRNAEIVLIDTAGRLHTKTDLMQELEKIKRVMGKALPGAPHETLLILDATTGQNGLEQAQIFHKFTPLTGLILTKIDGTAKGGTALAIHKKLQLPIRYLGTGEGMDDLILFNPEAFAHSLF